ncbi:MAG: sigma-70 family RNA polymerase sigma factor [Acidobacteriota bacterium]
MDFSALRDAVENAVAAVCPGWLIDRRDDLVQAAMLGLMKAHERRPMDFSPPYLKRVAFHALVDEIRRQRRRREVPLEGVEQPPRARRANPEDHATGRQIGAAIRECLDRLIPSRRRAMQLLLLGHSMPEIAERLGSDVKRIQNLVFRGRAELRTCLSAKGVEP